MALLHFTLLIENSEKDEGRKNKNKELKEKQHSLMTLAKMLLAWLTATNELRIIRLPLMSFALPQILMVPDMRALLYMSLQCAYETKYVNQSSEETQYSNKYHNKIDVIKKKKIIFSR